MSGYSVGRDDGANSTAVVDKRPVSGSRRSASGGGAKPPQKWRTEANSQDVEDFVTMTMTMLY